MENYSLLIFAGRELGRHKGVIGSIDQHYGRPGFVHVIYGGPQQIVAEYEDSVEELVQYLKSRWEESTLTVQYIEKISEYEETVRAILLAKLASLGPLPQDREERIKVKLGYVVEHPLLIDLSDAADNIEIVTTHLMSLGWAKLIKGKPLGQGFSVKEKIDRSRTRAVSAAAKNQFFEGWARRMERSKLEKPLESMIRDCLDEFIREYYKTGALEAEREKELEKILTLPFGDNRKYDFPTSPAELDFKHVQILEKLLTSDKWTCRPSQLVKLFKNNATLYYYLGKLTKFGFVAHQNRVVVLTRPGAGLVKALDSRASLKRTVLKEVRPSDRLADLLSTTTDDFHAPVDVFSSVEAWR